MALRTKGASSLTKMARKERRLMRTLSLKIQRTIANPPACFPVATMEPLKVTRRKRLKS